MTIVSIDYGVWATVGEAAKILGVKTGVVSRCVLAGKLSCIYRNRQCFVRRADLASFVPPPPSRAGRPRKVKPSRANRPANQKPKGEA